MSKKTASKKLVKLPVVKKVLPVVKGLTRTVKHTMSVQLVQFEMSAVIPTMQYGNIQPKITVTAPSMEEARDAVMPIISGLYASYGEKALRSNVTVTEKVVEAPKVMADIAPKTQETSPKAPEAVKEVIAPQAVTTAPVAPIINPAVPAETPEAVRKAEKAISLAATEDALKLIEGQITNSVKIDPSYKPALLGLCKEKMASFAF